MFQYCVYVYVIYTHRYIMCILGVYIYNTIYILWLMGLIHPHAIIFFLKCHLIWLVEISWNQPPLFCIFRGPGWICIHQRAARAYSSSYRTESEMFRLGRWESDVAVVKRMIKDRVLFCPMRTTILEYIQCWISYPCGLLSFEHPIHRVTLRLII